MKENLLITLEKSQCMSEKKCNQCGAHCSASMFTKKFLDNNFKLCY